MLLSILCSCLLLGSALSDTLFFEPRETPVKVEVVVCPDGQSQCPDGSTCCKLTSGQYGCCPLPQAVCCSDHLHCCPSGTTCDVAQGKCNRGLETVPWFEKQPSKPVKVEDVVCPDGQSQCPDGSTCCKLASGQYGCCPLPQAVCCSDHLHCCPSGTTCDVAQGKCNRGLETLSWFKKQPAKPVTLESVVCPDGQSQCPDGSTCCKLASGQYGCCPLPQAVCCSDHLHCCPSGTTCDVAQGKCLRGEKSFTWLLKQPSLPVPKPVKVESVMCPDGQSQCPDGSTCCKLASGQYGCCPLPQAVCCSDHLHCCPSGTTCDVAQGKCLRGYETVAWFEKQPAKPVKVENVICPDGQSQCPDGSTCCKLASGQYGCCPLPQAVCCSDHLHCCPSGTTCDVAQGKCLRGEKSFTWLLKQPSLPVPKPVKVESVVCPDGQSQCPDGSTCCKLASGQYGCCPLPQAVCCSDHLHCCPSGTTCDVAQGKCLRGEKSFTWLLKQPSLPVPKPVKVEVVVCPDGQSQCPDGSTCCKLASGQYGCCPLPQAVCCSDHLHCCPSGTTCDVAQGKCLRGEKSFTWLLKQPSLPVPKPVKVESVMCPDGQSQCPDGSTCCKLASGQYGCCPLPQAVCCSDMLHCCPQGTTCDVAQGKCLRGLIPLPWVKKLVPAPPRN